MDTSILIFLVTSATSNLIHRNRKIMAIEPVKPRPITRAQIIKNARAWLGVPYKLGGGDRDGIDCSHFVSTIAWANQYYTTDLIYRISHPISKEELKPGDALNIPESGERGHIMIFDSWANEDHTRLWIYDSSAACGGVCHREIEYDDSWVPIRYNWVLEDEESRP